MGWLEGFRDIAKKLLAINEFDRIVSATGDSWARLREELSDKLPNNWSPEEYREIFFKDPTGPGRQPKFARDILRSIATEFEVYLIQCAEVLSEIDKLSVGDDDRLIYEFWGSSLVLDDVEQTAENTRILANYLEEELQQANGFAQLYSRPDPRAFFHKKEIVENAQRKDNYSKTLLAVLHVKEREGASEISKYFKSIVYEYIQIWEDRSQLSRNPAQVMVVFKYAGEPTKKWWQDIVNDEKCKPHVEAGRILPIEIDIENGADFETARTKLRGTRAALTVAPQGGSAAPPQKLLFVLDSGNEKFQDHLKDVKGIAAALGGDAGRITWFTPGNPAESQIPDSTLIGANQILFVHRLLDPAAFGTTESMNIYHLAEFENMLREMLNQKMFLHQRWYELRNLSEKLLRIYWRTDGVNWNNALNGPPVWSHSGDVSTLQAMIGKILGLSAPEDPLVYAAFEAPKSRDSETKYRMTETLDLTLRTITEKIDPPQNSRRESIGRLSQLTVPPLFKQNRMRPDRLNIILGNIDSGPPDQRTNVATFVNHNNIINEAIRKEHKSVKQFPLLKIAAIWSDPDGISMSFPNVADNGLGDWNFVRFGADGPRQEDLEEISGIAHDKFNQLFGP